MPNIIKGGEIVADDWKVLDKDTSVDSALEKGKLIVPLHYWLANSEALNARGDIGVWLDSDEDTDNIEDSCNHLPVIAVNFPNFADGRGYSYARLLREKYGYSGELRAIGDVLKDQLFFYKRCGFDAFAMRVDRDASDAISSLKDFSDSYQVAVDQPEPLFKRR
ncbi:MAG: hypothetical protein ACI90U_001074 [Pseudomonadales bacterium]|jgi:uncharacterized protein (DUF934 family)